MHHVSNRTRATLAVAALLLAAGPAAAAGTVFDAFDATCIASGANFDKAVAALEARKANRLYGPEDDLGMGAATAYMLDDAAPVFVRIDQRGDCSMLTEASQAADLQARLADYVQALKKTSTATARTSTTNPGETLLALWEVDWAPGVAMYLRLAKAEADGVEGVMLSRAFVTR